MILAGDVGGTKTVLAICHRRSPSAGGADADSAGLAIAREAVYLCADYPSLEAILDDFITPADRNELTSACLGVAGAVTGSTAKITNLPWIIDAAALGARLGGAPVMLLNDLQATALGMLALPGSAFAVLQAGTRAAGGTIGVIAPGTGLGEAVLVFDGTRYRALPSEAGHADFAPGTDEEIELWRFMRNRHGRISNEHVLSGSGIGDIYDFVRHSRKLTAPNPAIDPAAPGDDHDRNAAISRAGLDGSDPAAAHALEIFAEALGAEAGNLALRALATGGVIIGGGIPPKLLPVLQQPRLIERFTAKGKFADWARNVSVRIALEPRAALLGAAHHAAQQEAGRP